MCYSHGSFIQFENLLQVKRVGSFLCDGLDVRSNSQVVEEDYQDFGDAQLVDSANNTKHARVEAEEVGWRVDVHHLQIDNWNTDDRVLWSWSACVCRTKLWDVDSLLGGIEECFQNSKGLFDGGDCFVFASGKSQGDGVGVPVDAVLKRSHIAILNVVDVVIVVERFVL